MPECAIECAVLVHDGQQECAMLKTLVLGSQCLLRDLNSAPIYNRKMIIFGLFACLALSQGIVSSWSWFDSVKTLETIVNACTRSWPGMNYNQIFSG